MLIVEAEVISYGRYSMSFYTTIKAVPGRCILKQKGGRAVGSEISVYRVIGFDSHFTQELHALKDWDIHQDFFFLVTAS